jgi:hypothetical protein
MDFGMTSNIGQYYLSGFYKQSKTAEKSSGVSFRDAIYAEAADIVKEQTNVTETSSQEMWQTRFPGAYYHVMDASQISQSVWDRNDFPFEEFFQNEVDESVLNWRSSGKEPTMSDSQVQTRLDSTLGQKSIIVPPELEEKMKNNPELAKK